MFVSLVTGVGLFFYERGSLEESAIDMTKSLVYQAFEQGGVSKMLSDKERLEAFLDKMVQGQFKYIELYDEKGQSLGGVG